MTAPARTPLAPCLILGDGDGERAEGFSAALVRAGLPPARVIDYARFAEAPDRLADLFPDGHGLLRLDSPGAARASAGRSCALPAPRTNQVATRARSCAPTMPCRAGWRRRFASPGGSCRPGSP